MKIHKKCAITAGLLALSSGSSLADISLQLENADGGGSVATYTLTNLIPDSQFPGASGETRFLRIGGADSIYNWGSSDRHTGGWSYTEFRGSYNNDRRVALLFGEYMDIFYLEPVGTSKDLIQLELDDTSLKVYYSSNDGTPLVDFSSIEVDPDDYGVYILALDASTTLTITLGPGSPTFSLRDESAVAALVNGRFMMAFQAVNTTINGSHHRLLMDNALDADGWHTWVTGDFADDQDSSTSFTSGEIGASRSVGSDDLRLGLGLGHSNSKQKSMYKSTSRLEGEHLVAEANYRLNDKVILSALGYYGDFRSKSSRNAADGSYTASGNTDVTNFAGRLRADWKNAYENGKLSLTPRIAYTYTDVSVDGYTETGAGVNNVTLEKQSNDAHEFRAGLDLDYVLNEKTLLRGIIEAVHINGDNDSILGSTDSTTFNVPSDDSISDTWARLGIEAVRQLSDTANVHASIFRSSEGYDATVSGAIGFNFSF